MTNGEGNRLAAVEAKIDSMARDITKDMNSLKEFLIEKINASDKATGITMAGQEKAIGIAMTASEKAIVKAEIATDLRFSDVEKRISDYVESTDKNIKILTENKDINVGSKTGATESKVDLTRYIGWIVSGLAIIGFIISQVIR